MNTESKIDINKLLIKPIFYGLFINILMPVILLGIVYYLDSSGFDGGDATSSEYNIFFWALCVISIIEGMLAFFFRQRLFFAPMIVSKETFEKDLHDRFLTNCIICFAFTSAIAVYGVVLFFMGGPFETTVLFVLISMIAYQLVRPRVGFTEKVVAAQEKHVEEGRFAPAKK